MTPPSPQPPTSSSNRANLAWAAPTPPTVTVVPELCAQMERQGSGMGAIDSPTRWHISRAQRRVLERTYKKHPYPVLPLREQLGRELNVTPRQVQIWFQNRRQRARTGLDEEELSDGDDEEEGVRAGGAPYSPSMAQAKTLPMPAGAEQPMARPRVASLSPLVSVTPLKPNTQGSGASCCPPVPAVAISAPLVQPATALQGGYLAGSNPPPGCHGGIPPAVPRGRAAPMRATAIPIAPPRAGAHAHLGAHPQVPGPSERALHSPPPAPQMPWVPTAAGAGRGAAGLLRGGDGGRLPAAAPATAGRTNPGCAALSGILDHLSRLSQLSNLAHLSESLGASSSSGAPHPSHHVDSGGMMGGFGAPHRPRRASPAGTTRMDVCAPPTAGDPSAMHSYARPPPEEASAYQSFARLPPVSGYDLDFIADDHRLGVVEPPVPVASFPRPSSPMDEE